jgi:hypothetical protein
MKQQLRAGSRDHLIRGNFESRVVIGLSRDLAAEQHVWRVQPAEVAHACQQIIRYAVDDLFDRAMHIGMQTAEIGDPRSRSHAAQKAIALDQERALASARRGRGRCNSGRAAPQNNNIEFTEDRRLPAWLCEGAGTVRHGVQ